MIIKSSIRGFSGELADHLGNTHDNESASITGVARDLYRFDKHGLPVADELRLMFAQMDLKARSYGKDDNHIYHVSMSPSQTMDDAEWEEAWGLYEAEFCLERCLYVEVTHNKEGRLHRHRAYYALDEQGKGLRISHSYPRNEKIARVIEHECGHTMTAGRHNRAVMKRLQVEGKENVSAWMAHQNADQRVRPAAAKSFDDHRQEQRTDWPKKQAQADVKDIYQQADNGKGFERALIERGYFLAQGESRPWVVIDPRGGIHSAPRYAGVKKAEFEQKIADLKWDHLPSIKQVQEHIRQQDQKKARASTDGGQSGSGSASSAVSAPRSVKDNSVSRLERAQTFKALNESLRQERIALRKAYHGERQAIWKAIGIAYQEKREALKSSYKPHWIEHFGRKHEELKTLDANTRNLSGRIIMVTKYRQEIWRSPEQGSREDVFLKDRVSAYVQHLTSQQTWLDKVEKKYEIQKQELFQRYKGECKELYKENRAQWQPVIEEALKGFKSDTDILAAKQAVIRQSVETVLAEKSENTAEHSPAQKPKSSAIDRVAALRDKNKDKDGAERER